MQSNVDSTTGNEYLFNDYLPVTVLNYYRLRSIDTTGDFIYSDTIQVKLITSVAYQNVPNLFCNSTTIRYQVADKALVRIVMYDNPGFPVAVSANKIKKPGSYEVQWNAGNIASGNYFYTVIIGDNVRTMKMLKLN